MQYSGASVGTTRQPFRNINGLNRRRRPEMGVRRDLGMGGECTARKVAIPRTAVGCDSCLQPFPRVRKERVPGVNVLARLRRGQPEGLQGT